MIEFYLHSVCLPHLAGAVPVEEIARQTGLRRDDRCSIEGCLHFHCSADGSLGCVDLQKDYCSLALTHDEAFASLDAKVSAVLASSGGDWTRLPPTPNKSGYGSAYCNSANSVGVETFGVAPDHAPEDLKRYVHASEYDLLISTRSEPDWCLRRRQASERSSGDR